VVNIGKIVVVIVRSRGGRSSDRMLASSNIL